MFYSYITSHISGWWGEFISIRIEWRDILIIGTSQIHFVVFNIKIIGIINAYFCNLIFANSFWIFFRNAHKLQKDARTIGRIYQTTCNLWIDQKYEHFLRIFQNNQHRYFPLAFNILSQWCVLTDYTYHNVLEILFLLRSRGVCSLSEWRNVVRFSAWP